MNRLKIEPRGKRVLAVCAHPDDLEFYCGGTMARLAAAGAEIVLLLATAGDKGSFDPGMPGARLAELRLEEALRGAHVMGLSSVYCLGYPDGELAYGVSAAELRCRIAGVMRAVRPNLLVTFDPWKRYELHPDHRRVGQVTLDARLAAKLPLYPVEARLPRRLPVAGGAGEGASDGGAGVRRVGGGAPGIEQPAAAQPSPGLRPWAIPEIWLFQPEEANLLAEIGPFFPAKLAALQAHASQFLEEKDTLAAQLRSEAAEEGRRWLGKADAWNLAPQVLSVPVSAAGLAPAGGPAVDPAGGSAGLYEAFRRIMIVGSTAFSGQSAQ
ncbi:MAG: PIG-L family deacetylase [Firmicutes bacterium]|nr:PIG-L family deacetylase [Bacillota bacterium]